MSKILRQKMRLDHRPALANNFDLELPIYKYGKQDPKTIEMFSQIKSFQQAHIQYPVSPIF